MFTGEQTRTVLDVFLVCTQLGRNLAQFRSALGKGQRGLGRERGMGGLHGIFDIFLGRRSRVADQFRRAGGVEDVVYCFVRCRTAFAIHEDFGRDDLIHARHVGATEQ